MKTVKILFFCHLAALLFGLGGMLIALPHPELWANNAFGVEVFNFGIRYAGSLHILFGAATMLLFGLLFVGRRKTLIFFVVATLIPLCMELLGTSTGFPFGPYSYTSFLGFKILGLVPYSIPLSWFYMGFTSYILASGIIAKTTTKHPTTWALALGIYFLTVWDLSLDPAMASQRLPVHFWIWYSDGPYFGMPISNLVGWSVTGLIYIGISRLLWGSNLDMRRLALWLPYGVYVANTIFAIALNLSVGLWIPVLMATLLGLIPASLALFWKPAERGGRKATVPQHISWFVVHVGSRRLTRGKVQATVEGQEHVPSSGPVLIVARHFHHLYDGCILLNTLPRRLHILVALDWVQIRWLRWLMEWACAMVEWPIILRDERLDEGQNAIHRVPTKAGNSVYSGQDVMNRVHTRENSVYSRDESTRYLRRAVKKSIELLRDGEALVVFPEAYPNIDPEPTPKKDEDAFLPFRPGFAKLVELAEKDGSTQVAIVPAGLAYTRNGQWHVTLRFGSPVFRQNFTSSTQLVQALEEQVHALSSKESAVPLTTTEEIIHS
jgi:putative membrane protein